MWSVRKTRMSSTTNHVTFCVLVWNPKFPKNSKMLLILKIIVRFLVAFFQDQPYTPPKDVRCTWCKLSFFYLLVCHTIFHCLVFFTASPHYWHSSWLCTLCKSCIIWKNRGKNTQTFKWFFSFIFKTHDWLRMQSIQPKFLGGISRISMNE